MTELENRLRTEDTEVLQGKLASASYTDEAAAIAKRVLAERGAPIPAPRTEEETETLERQALRRSTVKFSAVVLWLIGVWVFGLYEPQKYRTLFASFIPLAALLGMYRSR